MAIIFIVQGFLYLFGTVNTNLVKENYLLPNGFSTTEEYLAYPPNLFLIGRKELNLISKANNKKRLGSFEFVFAENGYLWSKLSVETSGEEVELSIIDELFSIEDDNSPLTNIPLEEIISKVSACIFGKSFPEIQLDHYLNTDFFKKYCEKYGINPSGDGSLFFHMPSLLSISEKDEWGIN